jgi:hypothetical protein
MTPEGDGPSDGARDGEPSAEAETDGPALGEPSGVDGSGDATIGALWASQPADATTAAKTTTPTGRNQDPLKSTGASIPILHRPHNTSLWITVFR